MQFKIISIHILLIFSIKVYSQEHIPCYGLSPGMEGCTLLHNDSLGYWSYPKSDTSIIVFISRNHRIYRHFEKKDMRLLVEGNFGGRVSTDAFMRYGQWIEYYQDGTIKTIGHYYQSQPIGQWQFYYENGQIRESYNISLIEAMPASSYCRTGSYQSFYSNGQIKVSGFYKAAVDSTTEERFDAFNGETYIAKCIKPVSKPFGIWFYYNESGEIIDQEEFKDYIDPWLWYTRQ